MTPEFLQAATGCRPAAAGVYAEYLSAACDAYAINTPERLAAFLAQIGHESGSLRYVKEIWGPTPAQLRYEGRADLGNTEPGDGGRFKGRGLIQITGRHNYGWLSALLSKHGAPDFIYEPEALELPRWAAYSAAAFWAERGCNELADAGDFIAITKRINGGLNGLDDRKARWETAKSALAVVQPKEEPMAPFLIPAVIELARAIPKLGSMFANSETAQRNVKAAEVVVNAVTEAVGASNAQEAVEKVQADPAAAVAATKAVNDVWYQISEAGGGGIDGARKADLAMSANKSFLWSPSFWMGMALLPLVYLIVLSVIGMVGSAEWSPEARAGIAGMITGTIVGGLVGYYFGQTTSRNRT